MQSNEVKNITIKENNEIIFLKEGEKENIKFLNLNSIKIFVFK